MSRSHGNILWKLLSTAKWYEYEQIKSQTRALDVFTPHAIWPHDMWMCWRPYIVQIKLKSLHGNIRAYRQSHRETTHTYVVSAITPRQAIRNHLENVFCSFCSRCSRLLYLPPKMKPLSQRKNVVVFFFATNVAFIHSVVVVGAFFSCVNGTTFINGRKYSWFNDTNWRDAKKSVSGASKAMCITHHLFPFALTLFENVSLLLSRFFRYPMILQTIPFNLVYLLYSVISLQFNCSYSHFYSCTKERSCKFPLLREWISV